MDSVAFSWENKEAVVSNWACWCIWNTIIKDSILIQLFIYLKFGVILNKWNWTTFILMIIARNSCNHGMIMFPTWNPDYVFEWEVGQSMSKTVDAYFWRFVLSMVLLLYDCRHKYIRCMDLFFLQILSSQLVLLWVMSTSHTKIFYYQLP